MTTAWAAWPAEMGWTIARDGQVVERGADRRHRISWSEVLERTGVTSWKRVTRSERWRFPHWVPDEGSTAVPCEVDMQGQGRWPTFNRCGRVALPESGKCKMHTNADRKAAEREAAWRERDEASTAGRRIAQDACDLIATVDLGGRQLKAQPYYAVPFGSGMGRYTGQVIVHAEDLTALIRRLNYLEGNDR